MIFKRLPANICRGVMHIEYAILLSFAVIFLCATDMMPSIIGFGDKHTVNSDINRDAYRSSEKTSSGQTNNDNNGTIDNAENGSISQDGTTLTPAAGPTALVRQGSITTEEHYE